MLVTLASSTYLKASNFFTNLELQRGLSDTPFFLFLVHFQACKRVGQLYFITFLDSHLLGWIDSCVT